MKSELLRLAWRKVRNCRNTYRATIAAFQLVVCRHDDGSFYRIIYRDGHMLRGSYQTRDYGDLVVHAVAVERELLRHIHRDAKRMARAEKALSVSL
jgi:hypothetical protein